MKRLNIAYFGSPDFSASFLEKLITDVSINQLIDTKLIVTQPDQPVGRKQILTPTPVKKVAEKYKIKYFTSFSDLSGLSDISGVRFLPISSDYSDLSEIDLALVYAFGSIIPKQMLKKPKYSFWCIHPSLLPKYRGTSPMATALINGDEKTGVTIIKMDEEIDHGPIIVQQSLTIEKTDRRPDLEVKLTNLAFEMFKKTIIQLSSLRVNELSELKNSQNPLNSLNNLTLKPQNHKLATYTKKLTKQDGFIKFDKLKQAINNQQLTINNSIYNLFRGLYPWPGIWTILPNGKRLKITQLSINNQQLTIFSVQLEGKKEVDFETFNSAYKIF